MTAARNFIAAKKLCIATLFVISALAFSFAPVHADGPAPNRRTARFEIDFMKTMIDHHNMAVEMAELCLDRAIHDELESMCEEVIAAQTAEIDDMQSWLDDWYGISYEPRMSETDRRQLRALAKLRRKKFEIEFMQMMIEHHSVAIEEAEECVDRAFHEELDELCHNIIETQSAEIDLLEGWLCDWYRICH